MAGSVAQVVNCLPSKCEALIELVFCFLRQGPALQPTLA
jgi:hypothetical protein